MDTGILHSLISLGDFKAILGLDDREDALSCYCLITATYAIDHYCKRCFYRKKRTDYLTFTGEYVFTLREYPVRKVLAVWAAAAGSVQRGNPPFSPENLVDSKHFYCLPDEGIHGDIPFSLVLRPPIRLSNEEMGIRVRYLVRYVPGKAGDPCGVPADLASACLELAAGLKTFTLNGIFLAPRRAALFIYTLNVSRALLGVEHESLPGAVFRDDRKCPGVWQGRGTSGSLHAGERAGASGTVPAKTI
jgi:hypothetical protein